MDKVESTIDKGGAPTGNKNAAKGAQLTSMLVAAINDNDRAKLRSGVQKVADAFADGERWAIEFVFDRAEGKAAQAVTLKGDEDNPIHVNHGLSESLTRVLDDIISGK